MSHEKLGEIPLTADEAEAAGQKYWAWKILRLESGKWAVWDPGYQLVALTDDPLGLDLSYEGARKATRTSQPKAGEGLTSRPRSGPPSGAIDDFM